MTKTRTCLRQTAAATAMAAVTVAGLIIPSVAAEAAPFRSERAAHPVSAATREAAAEGSRFDVEIARDGVTTDSLDLGLLQLRPTGFLTFSNRYEPGTDTVVNRSIWRRIRTEMLQYDRLVLTTAQPPQLGRV